MLPKNTLINAILALVILCFVSCSDKLPEKTLRNSIFVKEKVILNDKSLARIEDIASEMNVDFSSSKYESNNYNAQYNGMMQFESMVNAGSGQFTYSSVDRGLMVYSKAQGVEKIIFIDNNFDVWVFDVATRKSRKIFRNPSIKSIFASAIVYEDSIIYSNSMGDFVSIDIETGKVNWSMKDPKYAFYNSFKNYNGVIYGVSKSGSLFAIDPKIGREIWTYKPQSEKIGSSDKELMASLSQPVFYGNYVLFPTHHNMLEVLQIDSGMPITSVNIDVGASASTGLGGTIFSVEHPVFSPALHKDLMFIGSIDGSISIMDPKTMATVAKQAIGGVNSAIVQSQNFSYFITRNNNLVAMHNYTGAIKWINELDKFYDYNVPTYMSEGKGYVRLKLNWRGPLVLNGKNILLVSPFGKVVFVSVESGEIVKKFDVPTCIFSTPVVAAGKVYFYDQCKNNIHILG